MKRNSREHLRVAVFFGFIGLAASLVLWRLFVVSYRQHSYYMQAAQNQNDRTINILTRGNIYFSTGKEPVLAAANQKFPVLTINSSKLEMSKVQEIVDSINRITGISPERISRLAQARSDFARPLEKHLNNGQVAQIKKLGLPGVGTTYVTDRFYPNQELGADILGFLGYVENQRVGQYGIESFYNEELSGRTQPGWQAASGRTLASVFGRLFGKEQEARSESMDRPKDIYLTVDKNIQSFAEKTLDELLKRWSASGGNIIVQDPFSGKILAMVDRPSFNPNTYASNPPESFLNRNVQEMFEPGSSIKPITMAAGLDLNKINPDTTYTDTGSVEISGHVIKNFDNKAHGVTTMTGVLERSLNTGAMFIENSVGDDNFLNYIINMGFGQKSGIDLPGEASGDITNLYSGRKINFLTASFGQGIAVTPLQLINAYSAIANGGKLMRPYIVDRIVSDGEPDVVTKPEVVGIPISSKTSDKLCTMLVSVVDNGFDKARISGYDIAGKTGTAQIPDAKGGYAENEFIHDFLGFAPARNPKFVILIKMDRPRGITFAADSLSPVFREMTEFLLNYYNIPPGRK